MFILVGNDFKDYNLVLGVLIAIGLAIVFRSFQWAKLENIFKGDGWEFYKTDEKYGSKDPRGIT